MKRGDANEDKVAVRVTRSRMRNRRKIKRVTKRGEVLTVEIGISSRRWRRRTRKQRRRLIIRRRKCRQKKRQRQF